MAQCLSRRLRFRAHGERWSHTLHRDVPPAPLPGENADSARRSFQHRGLLPAPAALHELPTSTLSVQIGRHFGTTIRARSWCGAVREDRFVDAEWRWGDIRVWGLRSTISYSRLQLSRLESKVEPYKSNPNTGLSFWSLVLSGSAPIYTHHRNLYIML